MTDRFDGRQRAVLMAVRMSRALMSSPVFIAIAIARARPRSLMNAECMQTERQVAVRSSVCLSHAVTE